MPDPNHDNKNHRYQLIDGSGCAGALISFYTLDPLFVAKATGVSVDVVRVSDYAPDLCVLCLFSAKIVQAMLKMNTNNEQLTGG